MAVAGAIRSTRPPTEVLRDVLWHKVSVDGALIDYGVVITEIDTSTKAPRAVRRLGASLGLRSTRRARPRRGH